MHKSKIDMADEIFVINPNGYIGESTWSEICYAFMTGKTIDAIEPIDRNKIEQKVSLHIKIAEMHAARQYDIWTHLSANYPSDDFLLKDMAIIKKGKYITMDPWVPEDESIPTCDYPFIGNADKKSGYDPFKIYGKQKMARFIEEIIMRYRVEEASKSRKKMIDEITWYCKELDVPLPQGFSAEMTNEEMQKWIECWDEFDPCPDI